MRKVGLIKLLAPNLTKVFNDWLRTARLAPYQGGENAVPVPKKLDREERAKPDVVILKSSWKVRTSDHSARVATAQLAFLHAFLIATAMSKKIKSLLDICIDFRSVFHDFP